MLSERKGRLRTNYYLWEMRPYFRQVAGQLVVGSIAGIMMNTAVVLPAIFLGRAIDAVLEFERGEVGAGNVAWAALAFAGGVALYEVPRVGKRWWLLTANARIRANMRANALRGVIIWPMAQLDSVPTGDLMARTIGDVEVLGVGVREFIVETWDTLLFSVSLIVAMLIIDVDLTAVAMIPIPLAMLLAKFAGRWVGGRTTASRESNASLTVAIQERLSSIRLLRMFGRTPAAVEQVDDLSQAQADANLSLVRLRSGLRPVYITLMTAGVLVVVWRGGSNVIGGAMTVGAFVAYLELYLRFVNRGFRIPQLINSIQSGSAAYARLRPLLAPPPGMSGEPRFSSFSAGHIAGIHDQIPPRPSVPSAPATISLRNVTFRYPSSAEPTLTDISLDVQPGSLVAITGPVGSGKSALAKTLLGLYSPDSGQVFLDGVPLEEIPATERTTRVGYLPQEPYLFSGTVRENILPDSPVAGADTTLAVDMAVTAAALEEDLLTFPDGLETEIGELGVLVSGGQRQRIALARAIASTYPASPALLVLDDPFSAIDLETEERIIGRLRELFGPEAPPERRCSIVLFSHRLSAFPKADLVVVLAGGRVTEQGTHAELSRSRGLYARIYNAQQVAARGGTMESRRE
ncbi:MAG: ABC transporter ATP-binding protein [Chloroflexi bacterium]|nr:ABC transporter ATP-binding protein [Chloroflexota bacterium]